MSRLASASYRMFTRVIMINVDGKRAHPVLLGLAALFMEDGPVGRRALQMQVKHQCGSVMYVENSAVIARYRSSCRPDIRTGRRWRCCSENSLRHQCHSRVRIPPKPSLQFRSEPEIAIRSPMLLYLHVLRCPKAPRRSTSGVRGSPKTTQNRSRSVRPQPSDSKTMEPAHLDGACCGQQSDEDVSRAPGSSPT